MSTCQVCQGCSQEINGARLKTASGLWHEKCLACFKCHGLLAGKELIEKDGKVYCPDDYHLLFSPRCAGCKKAVTGSALKLGGSTYHPECVKCAKCTKQLTGKVFLVNGDIVCESCQVAPEGCEGCKKGFGSEPYIIALSKHWHKDCFKCTDCSNPFGATAFLVVDGKPYCAACNDAKFCEKCAGCSKPIRDKSMVKALDNSFHEDCFTCQTCKKKLINAFFKTGPTTAQCKKCHDSEKGVVREKKPKPEYTYDADEVKKYNVATAGREAQDIYYELNRKKAIEQTMAGEDKVAAGLKGAMFEDPSFPADARSLFANKDKDCVWLRPKEMDGCTDPQVFCGGVSSGDVCQGGLGDCWFLSALSILAIKPEYLKKLVVSEKYKAQGLYTVRFFKNGTWYNVIIDDRIPCHPNSKKPLFAKGNDPNEIWVMLLEKAYAKIHSTYGRLEGGIINYGLRDLTGGPPETVHLAREIKTKADSERIWKEFMDYEREGFLMGCAMASNSAGVEADSGEGILANHAYGILDFHEPVAQPGLCLLHVRNPWGRCEWTGRYSDYDTTNWTPALKTECKFTSEDDGTFWMCWEDFSTRFNEVYITRLFDESWEHIRKKASWKGVTAGGCCNNKSWCNNPQFHLRVPVKSHMFFILTQTDARMRLDGKDWRKYDYAVGTVISKSEEFGQRKLALYQGDQVAVSPFIAARASSVTAVLEAGEYVCVPSTFNAGEEEDFVFTVYSKVNNDMSRMFTLEGGEAMDCIVELDEIPDSAVNVNSAPGGGEGTDHKEHIENSDSD